MALSRSLAAVFVSLIVSSAFLSCSTAAKKESISPPKYEPIAALRQAYDATQTIFLETEEKVSPIGSGVTVRCQPGAPRVVLTAWHVVEAIVDYQSKSTNPESIISYGHVVVGNSAASEYHFMKLIRFDKNADLAVLVGIKPEENACPAVHLATRLPLIGSDVWAIGTPLGVERNVTKGVLSSISDRKGVTLYRMTADIFFGNSGGPLFNAYGELIGINVSLQVWGGGDILWPVPGGYYAVALPHLQEILNGV